MADLQRFQTEVKQDVNAPARGWLLEVWAGGVWGCEKKVALARSGRAAAGLSFSAKIGWSFCRQLAGNVPVLQRCTEAS